MIVDSSIVETDEELFEQAPCGYLATLPDGTVLRANQTFAEWVGGTADELVGRRFQEFLNRAGRISYETNVAPLLHVRGTAKEVALDIVRGDGSSMATLVTAVARSEGGRPQMLRILVFDATERRSYERELVRVGRQDHEIARELQQSLLAGDLPADERLAIDVAYRTAVAGTETGGDWFDAFWIDEGASLALVVGDVVGRGIGAAATMGQLRSAARALALTGMGPAAVLEALDAFVARHAVGAMTTLVYAQLSLATRELRFASAGHPPIVLVAPGAPPAFTWDGRSTPLDSTAPRARDEASVSLAPGTTVVLYTDGLIERRSLALDAGMQRLLEQLTDAEVSADQLVDGMLADLASDVRADDVCVLTARVA
jgi:PAS domain S-box-containing protein